MSTDGVKLIIKGCLYLGVIAGILGCTLLNNAANEINQEPVRRLRITIEESQREDLFAQFQKFAEAHNFKIDITDFNTNGEHFQVWMSGDSIQIVASDIPRKPNEASIDFYGLYPGYPVDEETIDELLTDLKSFIGEIPNVTIMEEQ